MHDRKGRLIEVGDVVRAKFWNDGKEVEGFGVVVTLTPGATACNLQATHIVKVPSALIYHHTASQVELVAKGDGSELSAEIAAPAPAGD